MSLLVPHIRKHLPFYLAGILAIFFTNWLAVNIPVYIQHTIDILLDPTKVGIGTLSGNLRGIFLLSLFMVVVRTLSRILFFNPGRAIERDIKNSMFRKLMALPKDYFEKNPAGSSISKINNDINGVRLLCGFAVMQLFNICFAFTLTPLKMWHISHSLTLTCLVPILVIFVAVRISMQVIIKSMNQRQIELQELSETTLSCLAGIDIIKAYKMFDWALLKFQVKNINLQNLSTKIAFLRAFVFPLLGHLENILKIIILWSGTKMVINHELSAGQITAYMTYVGLLAAPLSGLGWLTTIYQQGLVGIKSIQTILDQEEIDQHVQGLPAAPATDFARHGIEVRNLDFAHEPGGPKILDGISFTIRPGQIVGMLGPIGSGKSTLANCLNGYQPVADGKIFIGGVDIRHLRPAQVRSMVKTVTQEPFLFSESIAENIQLGCGDIPLSSQAIDAVIRQCAMADEVDRLPERENTLVGEKGIMLSGGQKQRISLARALVAPCQLLILDNVLSAVDYNTERYLLGQIYDNKGARSLFIISHRVSILTHADIILVLEAGRIIARGRHADLLRDCASYRQTWELQQALEEVAP